MPQGKKREYQQPVSRVNRTAFILLLDMSGSMVEMVDYADGLMSKSACVRDVAERVLQELYLRANHYGKLCDYYDVAVVSYSGRGVLTHLGSSDSPFVSITKLKGELNEISVNGVSRFDTPEYISEVYADGITLEPRGDSPMYEALLWLRNVVDEWCEQPQNRESYPPTIFHITDGQATDGSMNDIVEVAQQVMSVGTNDGNVLLFNMQLAELAHGQRVLFPTDDEVAEHQNSYFRRLGEASSLLPEHFAELVNEVRDRPTTQRCRGIGYNASVIDIVSMMTIGTQCVTAR